MATNQDSFKVYLPTDLADEIREATKKDGRTVTGLVRKLLQEWLDKQAA